MTKEKKQKIVMAIIGCASMGSLIGCSNQESTTNNDNKTNGTDDVESAMEIVKNTNLTVDQEKCVGCGKCPRIASANFAMNSSRKAEVISQEITSQTTVDRAIDACPTNAILQ